MYFAFRVVRTISDIPATRITAPPGLRNDLEQVSAAVQTSNHIVFAQGDVNQIPGYMNERGMHFLDAVDAVGRDDKAKVGHLSKAPAVFAEPGNREHLLRAGGF